MGLTPPHSVAEDVPVEVRSDAGPPPCRPGFATWRRPASARSFPATGPTAGGVKITVAGNDFFERRDDPLRRHPGDRQAASAARSYMPPTKTRSSGACLAGQGTVSVWARDPVTGVGQPADSFTVHRPARGRSLSGRSSPPTRLGLSCPGGDRATIRPRLLGKLTLLALGVSLIPLSIVGYFSYRIGQTAVRAAVDESQLQLGRQVAQHVSTELDHLLETLRVDARVLDLPRAGDQAPTAEGIAKFLQLVYHQSDAFCRGGPVRRARPFDRRAGLPGTSETSTLRSRATSRCTRRDVASLAPDGADREMPLAAAPRWDRCSRRRAQARTPHVVLAVSFTQTVAGERRVLAAEVALRGLMAHVEALASDDTEVKLLDGHTRLLGHRARSRPAACSPPRLPGRHRAGRSRWRSVGNISRQAGRSSARSSRGALSTRGGGGEDALVGVDAGPGSAWPRCSGWPSPPSSGPWWRGCSPGGWPDGWPSWPAGRGRYRGRQPGRHGWRSGGGTSSETRRPPSTAWPGRSAPPRRNN